MESSWRLSNLQQSQRLYYSDSFLRTFTAEVTDVRELDGNGGDTVWQVSLSHTAFYPASGGQPFDTGVRERRLTRPAFAIPVEQVEEDERGTVWHFVRQPLSVGAQIKGQIEWGRRFDHMQQHTGQHLLSAVFLRELEAATVSFHLGEKISAIDLNCAEPGRP